MKNSAEQSNTMTSSVEQAEGPAIVFQPQKLTEIVEMIDLMGRISERVREDNSRDVGGGATAGAAQKGGKGATVTARDQAIANLPAPLVMQQRLVQHIQKEIDTLASQASALGGSTQRGAAFALNEMYRKIRRLYSLLEEIVHATAELIRLFYITVFIDKQPILVSGNSFARG